MPCGEVLPAANNFLKEIVPFSDKLKETRHVDGVWKDDCVPILAENVITMIRMDWRIMEMKEMKKIKRRTKIQ